MRIVGSIAVHGGGLVLHTPAEMLCYEAVLVKALVAEFIGTTSS